METNAITIDKDELFTLIRKAVRVELNNIEDISDEEQKELEELHGDSLYKDDYNKKDFIKL